MNVSWPTIDPKTGLGLFGILALTFLGYMKGVDVSMAIAMVACGTGAAHAYQNAQTYTAPSPPGAGPQPKSPTDVPDGN